MIAFGVHMLGFYVLVFCYICQSCTIFIISKYTAIQRRRLGRRMIARYTCMLCWRHNSRRFCLFVLLRLNKMLKCSKNL